MEPRIQYVQTLDYVSIAFSGHVAGRIDEVLPVRDIIEEAKAKFIESVEGLSRQYLS